MASPAKKPKINSKTKNYFIKQNQKGNKSFLKAGDSGYLVTFNYKAKESIREVYKLLNEYHKEYYGQNDDNETKTSDNEEDIDDELSKAINETKEESKKKVNLFNSVDTGTNGLIFIKASIPEFYELGEKIIRDLSSLKHKKTKFTNRFVPILKVCRANMNDIINTAGELFDQHFLKDHCTFAINFNKRLNNDIQRDDVIKQLAALVSQKNILNKVDLRNPKKTILVEVIKGLCCLSVINDYILLKKYNLNELCVKTDGSQSSECVAEKKPLDSLTQEISDDNGTKNDDDENVKDNDESKKDDHE